MSDDLIRRSDAIGACAYETLECYEARKTIRNLPPADRPQGEWIVNISDYKSVCSVCGANEMHFIYGTEMWYGLGKSHFCPYCGARMKGGKP